MPNHKTKIPGLDLILVRGTDAENFLQGQITNDIKLIEKENEAIYAGYCNPKGRLIAFFLIIKVWDNYCLFCPSSISDEIRAKLSMFILRSQVLIEKGKFSYFGFYGGTRAEKEFKNFWGDVPYPTNIMETVKYPIKETVGFLSIIKLPGGLNSRFLVLGEDEAIETVQDEIFQNVDPDEDTLIDKKSWNASDIEAKIPNIFKETQDKFIPQSLNLDLIDAVNFKKGCYTGQEIVARTHYLGKPKRRMYLGSINSPESFKIGDEITANGEKVGQIINFYEEDADFYTILFEIRIEKINLELILGKNKIINIDELN
tara:strand:+ start:359 stop:1303 length:945 start_codon:yes stop_codon:yes gene_type:complete